MKRAVNTSFWWYSIWKTVQCTWNPSIHAHPHWPPADIKYCVHIGSINKPLNAKKWLQAGQGGYLFTGPEYQAELKAQRQQLWSCERAGVMLWSRRKPMHFCFGSHQSWACSAFVLYMKCRIESSGPAPHTLFFSCFMFTIVAQMMPVRPNFHPLRQVGC